MSLDEKYEVLFLHGGASLQNCMIPYNVKTHGCAGYVDSGLWANHSWTEAAVVRNCTLVASSQKDNYTFIPSINEWDEPGYLHITTNNTVNGTQYHRYPQLKKAILVADMSSDILSREINYNQFGLIYAGLQKNLGVAGGSLVIIDKNLIEDLPAIPRMLNYKKHIEANSMLNTPPVFVVYMCNLVLKWIMNEGGIPNIEIRNKHKAAMLYDEIDRNSLFQGLAKESDRSLMNACFKLTDESLKAEFENHLEREGIIGLEGHRSKGGYRASLYNMLPVEHVEKLVDTLQKFNP
jgi:phosphoserine aminotransferase